MKTEVTVEEEVKKARRQVFWRLHSFPWILSIISLLLIIFGFIINSRRTEGRHMAQIEAINDAHVENMGIMSNNLEKVFRIDAVMGGHGKWEISDFGEVEFVWNSKNIYETEKTFTNWVTSVKTVTNYIIVTNYVNITNYVTLLPEIGEEAVRAFDMLESYSNSIGSEVASIDEEEFRSTIRILKKSGFDMEDRLIEHIDLTIDVIFDKFFPEMRRGEREFMEELRDRIHDMVENEFKGVKLYHHNRKE